MRSDYDLDALRTALWLDLTRRVSPPFEATYEVELRIDDSPSSDMVNVLIDYGPLHYENRIELDNFAVNEETERFAEAGSHFWTELRVIAELEIEQ